MKKLILFSLLLFASGCGFSEQKISQTAQEVVNLRSEKITTPKVFLADLKGTHIGKPTNVSISLKFGTTGKNFKTKASTDGQLPALVSDIQSYRIYLTSSNTTPSNASLIAGGNSFTVVRTANDLVSGEHTVTFTNVPVGTWFAAVEARDANNNNITAPIFYPAENQTLPLVLSGNSVTVNQDLTLTPAGEVLSVEVPLKDGFGANIVTTIVPADGADPGTYNAF